MGQGVRRQRRVEFPVGLARADQVGELVAALAHVVAHRPCDVLVAARGDQGLDDEVTAVVVDGGEAAGR